VAKQSGLSQNVLESIIQPKQPAKKKSNLQVVKPEAQPAPVEASIEVETSNSESKREPKWGRVPRQSYYVPENLHLSLRAFALTNTLDPSDIVVEGIQMALKKLGAEVPAQ
jgi:hypothetical protein